MTAEKEILNTEINGLKRIARGKVRDIYEVDAERLLLVTTDRVSAFDVVMTRGIPGRGKLLTQISMFWFDYFKDIVGNHVLETDVTKMPGPIPKHADQLEGRSMLVKRAKIFPVECVVRGYVAGSGWKDYQKTGAICGITLPAGLKQASRLEKPIFTPATKAEQGEHDENISYEEAAKVIGNTTAGKLRDLSLTIYSRAREYAAKRGIILADTKFEFGEYKGQIILCDEVLTPDSSRYWDANEYKEGTSPPSFDKQIIRDWLETQVWDKSPPPPRLPDNVIGRALERYEEVVRRLTR
ncbi:MAG: phosphoribosylaminoimidazolesuccinocarboxamide synthase [Planctomycetaceae bacterium]|nr:phosphoribosylaminoimidazolesuccinocarboxamide synthase [Planctomycetaceae bacterium]